MEPKPATGNGLNDTEPTKVVAVLLYPNGKVTFDVDEGVSAIEIFGVVEALRAYAHEIFEIEIEETEDE